jgi:hypothetical protein
MMTFKDDFRALPRVMPAIAMAGFLAGCMAPTPYVPRTEG